MKIIKKIYLKLKLFALLRYYWFTYDFTIMSEIIKINKELLTLEKKGS